MYNYRLKEKILKTKPVTYYRACHSTSSEPYIVKKLNCSMTWYQVLDSKSMTLCKNTKCKYIARIKYIIKYENSFYCIMYNSYHNLTDVIKNDIQKKDIFKLAKQLIYLTLGLYEEKLLIRDIRPSHLFMGKNSLKLYHFETVSEKDLTELDITEMQDMRYTPPEYVLTKKGATEKSMMFTIGLVIAEIIIGEPLINAKNKLEYIYQLTHLFPNERMDKMKGSYHDFKELYFGKNQTFVEKMQQSDIGPSLTYLLGQMLKIDHSERISITYVAEALDRAIDNEYIFHKNKIEAERENNLVNLPHKNQVNIEEETSYEIEFDFYNRPTLSSIPMIFNQKSNKSTTFLPQERNVEYEGNQPIIIKQSSSPKSPKREHDLLNKNVSKKSFSQKINMTPKQPVYKLHVFSSTKPNSIPPISHPYSPSMILPYNSFHSNGLINAFKNNEMLKNSRTSKQTTLHTVKRPQLTNYAMNEANLGLKVGLSNSLFSENHGDEYEYL